ncbi:hypothetical protein BDP27DRAFT_1315909 [Rhodocollybia butyracea]|uniref:VPS9 domain-containing protein n=1 Tax=Rhodocollybia butyracea TaxID=206335 RepID=A0A9P5Q734_9AGAR|nr:hypothetical protein BDP27DRAFT_1315909 [Rhodocollybia butyracea]
MDEADPTEPTGIITDSAHDDALASRIAALVMVDFGLRDLDLDVSAKTEDDEERKSGKEDQVMDILRACGNELCALEKVYTPREKAEAMVKAHRVLVDGLTKLPFAIDLKEPGSQPESELESEPPLLSGQKQDASEEELKTAVPWKKDDAFPQQIDDEDIDVSPQPEQEAELGKTSEVTEEMRIREPASKEQGNIIDSENSQSSPSLVATPNTSEITSSNRSAPAFSLDTLFPLLILSVVIANPPRLISHLLFTQRFLLTHQSQTPSKNGSSAAGEQAYCLVNLMAVAEFIGSLDLEGVVNARTARGTPLFSEDGPMPMPVMSLPITIGSRSGSRRASMSSQHSVVSRDGSAATTPVLSSSFTLRNRVEQQASALSSSANKVLTGMSGVMDSSIGGFGGLFKNMNVNLSLPGSLPLPGGFGFGGESSTGPVTPALDSAQSAALWNQTYLDSNKNLQAATSTPRDMMERKESGFSIKGLKLPSIPNMPTMPTIPNLTRSTAPGPGDAREKEMVNVSRPGSARSMLSTRSKKSVVGSLFGGESTEEDESEDVDGDEDEGTSYGDEDEDEAGDGESYDDDAGSDASDSRPSVAGDNRSIRSFESMMSDRKRSVKVDAARRVKKEQQTKMKKSTPLNTVAGAAGAARKSLSDRLARVSSGIAASTSKKGPPPAMLLSNPPRLDSPQSSQPPSPGLNQSPSSLPPPNSYFLGCTSAEDLRLGEVKELLREYQSLVQAVQAAGGYSLPATGSLSENPLGDL